MVDVFPTPTCEDALSCFGYVNNTTDVGMGGVIGTVMMLVMGSFMFMSMKGYGNKPALGATGLILGIFGILLRTLGWINDITLGVSIAFVIIGVWALISQQAKYDSLIFKL